MAYPRLLTIDKILAAGLKILETSSEVGLRPLARELDVKAPSLYRYTRSKQHLEKMLAAEGYRRLGEVLGSTLKKEASFASMARGTREFAKSQPQLYHLMHKPSNEPSGKSGNAMEAIQPIADHMGMDQNDGKFIAIFRALRSYVHGFISLELSGQFTRRGNLDQAFEQGLSIIMNSLTNK